MADSIQTNHIRALCAVAEAVGCDFEILGYDSMVFEPDSLQAGTITLRGRYAWWNGTIPHQAWSVLEEKGYVKREAQ